MSHQRPLILFTNDDGVWSPGLWASAAAFTDIADILVVAPEKQQSGMGRALPVTTTGQVFPHPVEINGEEVTVYGVDGTPGQAVQHGVLEIAPRRPSLVVSGINYGENTGNGVTISGTVGAAFESASLGIPALAVSQQTDKTLHMTHSTEVDFSTAAYFTRMFGEWMLNSPEINGIDIDLLKLDLPVHATRETPWRITRLSKKRVYWPARDKKKERQTGPLGYYEGDTSQAEPDSDVYAVFQDRVVSVTPISLDMTSRTDLNELQQSILATQSAPQS
jgi:5'-nucleotidase